MLLYNLFFIDSNWILYIFSTARDENGNILPVDVYARAYVYFLQNLEAHDLQFKIQALLQLRYVDPRLVFKEVAPNRTTSIMGEDDLRKDLWVPHLFFGKKFTLKFFLIFKKIFIKFCSERKRFRYSWYPRKGYFDINIS